MDHAGFLVLIILIGIVGFFFPFGRFDKARSFLEDWARENGQQLIDCERRSFLRGPFFLTTSNYQIVYRITVEDQSGQKRRGYARVGGWMTGLFSDEVDVRLGLKPTWLGRPARAFDRSDLRFESQFPQNGQSISDGSSTSLAGRSTIGI